MSDSKQNARQPSRNAGPQQPASPSYAGIHERHGKNPFPSQVGKTGLHSHAANERERRRTSSETGGVSASSSVSKSIDLKSSGRLSQSISSQPLPSPRIKPHSEPINPYIQRPASRAMRELYQDRPVSRGLRDMDTSSRPMSRGGVASMSQHTGSSNVRSSLTQEKFNRAGGGTPVSRAPNSGDAPLTMGALSSMPLNLFHPPPTASDRERSLSKDLNGSLMTRDPGSPGSPASRGAGEIRPPPPAGMRGALSWGVGPNAYEVDGRPGTRGGGPACELDGRPITRGGRPASRMRGSTEGPPPHVQLAPLDGMDPPPGGRNMPDGAPSPSAPSPSPQGLRDSRSVLGSRGGQPSPQGGSGSNATKMPGLTPPFPKQKVKSVPEHDIDQLVEALSDDGGEMQDEKSMNDLASYLDALGKRPSISGEVTKPESSGGRGANARRQTGAPSKAEGQAPKKNSKTSL